MSTFLRVFSRLLTTSNATRSYCWNSGVTCVNYGRRSQTVVLKRCPNATLQSFRYASSNKEIKNKSTMMYITAGVCIVVGLSYAAVPMYRIFCQATGYGGEVTRTYDDGKVEKMKKVRNRPIQIRFNADTSSNLEWKFRPQQTEIILMPGETALAFYTATNPTDRPVVGISTYNVIPFEAGQYFNKIQCFCFEEQRLNPHEQVDMPVFFYIDPEFDEDPRMENTDLITLSYTFFEAKEGMKLALPPYRS